MSTQIYDQTSLDLAIHPRTGLHVGLWAGQIALAGMFGMAGQMKLFTAISALSSALPWTADVPEALVRFIGTSELLGAIGLILPSVFRIEPKLSALAAAGLTTVMILASLFHASRGELGVVPINAVLGSLAAFVAWGRFSGRPIQPRA